ncbi:MAG: metalloregulator ArsR/SmtB family transcription factor [Dehalococcoidales bacterium]|nr:metalloregulator ArsR/SmtB family transcription factor [Dehalococcoidales bacterium]
MQDLIKTMKALSDETRLRIIRVLLERECCVCEIMQALDISQSRASRNLRILKEAGFLHAQRDGVWIVYSIGQQSTNQFASSLAKLIKEAIISNDLLEQDMDRLNNAARVGPKALQR